MEADRESSGYGLLYTVVVNKVRADIVRAFRGSSLPFITNIVSNDELLIGETRIPHKRIASRSFHLSHSGCSFLSSYFFRTTT